MTGTLEDRLRDALAEEIDSAVLTVPEYSAISTEARRRRVRHHGVLSVGLVTVAVLATAGSASVLNDLRPGRATAVHGGAVGWDRGFTAIGSGTVDGAPWSASISNALFTATSGDPSVTRQTVCDQVQIVTYVARYGPCSDVTPDGGHGPTLPDVTWNGLRVVVTTADAPDTDHVVLTFPEGTYTVHTVFLHGWRFFAYGYRVADQPTALAAYDQAGHVLYRESPIVDVPTPRR